LWQDSSPLLIGATRGFLWLKLISVFRLSEDAERHEARLSFFQVDVLAHDDVAAS
jgi:hypothetical protein